MKSRLAIIPGAPGGTGPELVAKVLADPETDGLADVLVVGDAGVLEMGRLQAGVEFPLRPCDPFSVDSIELDPFAWLPTETIDENDITVAHATETSGQSVLATLKLVLDLGRDGIVNGFVFAPSNKEAMHMAGIGCDDELQFMASYLGVENHVSEVNSFDGMWTSRVTSHIALRDVASSITREKIASATRLIGGLLKSSGIKRPRISVAALNPHAGDGGNFGTEEIDIIRPAVEALAHSQMSIDGPWPSDTVFLKGGGR